MNSTYSQRQALFAQKIAEFITWLFENGYEVTLSSGYERDGEGGHKPKSVHFDRMAQDLNIFLVGRLMDGLAIPGAGDWQSAHWAKIGAKWKANGPLFKWGGDFKSPSKDWNHFSITPDGVRA